MLNGRSACETALELLGRKLWPVPLHPPGVIVPGRLPPTKGKEPIHKGWGRQLPTEAELRSAYRDHPDAGVGVRLGPKGGVIDIEVDGPGGDASLRELLGGEPETLGWSSRRGPHHLFVFPDLFFQHRPKSSAFKLPAFPGLEFRVGKYDSRIQSACPPTIGEDGIPRQWNGFDLIANLPKAAVEGLVSLALRPIRIANNGIAVPMLCCGDSTPYGARALKGECKEVAMAAEGSRHNTLRASALRVASLAKAGALPWEDGRRGLADAAAQSGLADDEIRDILGWVWRHAEPRMTHMPLGWGGIRTGRTICVIPEPSGASLERAKARIPYIVVPPKLATNRKLAPLARVMIALHEEAARRGEREFHAPSRLIAELAGIGEKNFKTALRRLGVICKLGYVSMVDPGVSGTKKTGKANTWRWHDAPCPGEAVWNSASRAGAEEIPGVAEDDRAVVPRPARTGGDVAA